MSNTACAGIIVCFYCFDLPQFRGERMGATACLLWLFGAAGIACTYLFSFAFMVSASFRISCILRLCLAHSLLDKDTKWNTPEGRDIVPELQACHCGMLTLLRTMLILRTKQLAGHWYVFCSAQRLGKDLRIMCSLMWIEGAAVVLTG